MAPFDGKLDTKISPLIEGQVPDFVQADHPKYVQFLKSYYKFLEAAEITLTLTIDSIRLETVSTNHIVLEGDEGDRGDKINTESGTGTTGKFIVGETITGSTSKATAEVLVDDLGNKRLFVSSQQKFEIGETITGSTSEATATLDKYRANPVQNIQQLMEYDNPDNSTTTFIDEIFNMYLESIPRALASGTSKRNLIKNIKDLYAAKGTSEAKKLLLRLLFDEEAEIVYPNKFMLKPSKGNWNQPTIMRVAANTGADANDIIGQTITGSTSGATSVVLDAIVFSQGSVSVSQLEIDTDESTGTFQTGETITATSNTQDVIMSFVVKSFVNNTSISDTGSLYSKNDSLNIDTSAGNGRADIEVETISLGGVTGSVIDDRGQDYKVGDSVSFTANSADSNAVLGTGIITAVGATILLEDTIGNDDFLVQESATNISQPQPYIGLEDGDSLVLNGTNSSSLNDGFQLVMESATERDIIPDNYSTDNNRFMVEDGAADTDGEIARVVITSSGGGYSKLPTATITSTKGTGGKIILTSTTIGNIIDVKVKDGGFNYSTSPTTNPNSHFVLKDVSGTFVASNTLTTHSGTVKSFDSSSQHLEVDFDLVENIKTEAEVDVNEGIQLEQSTPTAEHILFDNTLDSDGDNIVLEDGQGNLISNSIKTFHTQITLENTGNVNQRIELEEKRADESLEQMFGLNAVQAKSVGVGSIEHPEKFVPNLQDRGMLLKLDASAVGGSFIIEDGGTDGSGTNAGDEILLDRTATPNVDAGDKLLNQSVDEGSAILYEDAPAIPHIQQRFNKFALNGTVLQRSTPKGWIADDGTLDGGETLYENQGGFRVADETEGILLEDEVADATYNTKEFLILEDGDLFEFYEEKVINHINTPDGRLMDEEDGGFELEKSRPEILIDESSDIVINNHIVKGIDNPQAMVLDGTNSAGANAGDFVLDEEFGDLLRQESGTGTDMGDLVLHETESNSANQKLIIDATDSSSSDAGDNIISESVPTLIGDTITDSGGATGVIVTSDTANVTANVGVESELTGFYINTDHHISDGVIRLQDSFFYQDFSYEIRIGQSVENYMTELKRAVHPSGFAAFGKVTLASLISANIQTPSAGGVSGFTADTDTFSPALASTLENIFQIEVKRRLGISTTLIEGELIKRVQLETATSSDQDSNIINEQTSEAISLETAAKPPNAGQDVNLIKSVKLTVSLPEPAFRTEAGSHSGLPLFAETHLVSSGIQLEDGTREIAPTISRDVILLDGTLSAGGSVVDSGEKMEMEDGSIADIGSNITFDDLQFKSNDTFVLEQSATFNETIELEYATEITEGRNTAPNQLILDGTDGSSTNAGDHVLHENSTTSFGDDLVQEGDSTPLVTEDILNGEITIEEIVRSSLISLEAKGGLRDNDNSEHVLMEKSMEVGDILLESAFELLLNEDGDRFDLEDDTGKIIREIGEDGGAGQKMIVEDATTPQLGGKIILDHQYIEMDDASDVTVPEINFRDTNFPRFTRPTTISQTARGKISLQDEREVTKIVLNGTNGSSANAGDNIISERDSDDMVYEDAASVILDQHNPGFVTINSTDGSANAGSHLEFEIGTVNSLAGSFPIFTTGDLASTYDATTLTYDSTQQTYDATT